MEKPNINNIAQTVLMILGVTLIIIGIMSYVANYYYKKGNYDISITINPLEPRYQMKHLLYQRHVDYNEIQRFYIKNRYNPYVSEYIILWYKNRLTNSNMNIFKNLLTMAKENYPKNIKINQLYKNYVKRVE